MATVGAAFAHRVEALIERLPSWRDITIRRPPPASSSPLALAKLIEGEVIPRLLVAHRAPDPVVSRPPPPIGIVEADAFATRALAVDAWALIEHAESFLARGSTIDSVLIDLLAPAARQLGIYWEEDRCDFVDVTMGLWRLQEVVHELASRMPVMCRADEHRALFSTMPGDQHSFGTALVDQFFRTAGWTTARIDPAEAGDLIDAVRSAEFDLVGLTITRAEQLETAPGLIADVRARSRNPDLVVMAGGRLLVERPELALLIGADGTAADARAAVARAEMLIEMTVRAGARHH